MKNFCLTPRRPISTRHKIEVKLSYDFGNKFRILESIYGFQHVRKRWWYFQNSKTASSPKLPCAADWAPQATFPIRRLIVNRWFHLLHASLKQSKLNVSNCQGSLRNRSKLLEKVADWTCLYECYQLAPYVFHDSNRNHAS